MSQAKEAVAGEAKVADLVKIGEMYSIGSEYVGPEEAMLKIVSKFAGQKVITIPHVAAREGVAEKGIAAVEEIKEESFLISDKTKDALLGQIAALPALRAQFAEMVAERINSAREGNDEYAAMLERLAQARAAIEEVEEEIVAFDTLSSPGFNIAEFVAYDVEDNVEPKDFTARTVRTGRGRKTSGVTWSLGEYAGPESMGSYTNLRLIKSGSEWLVYSDQGHVATGASASDAMKAALELAGLKTSRSAVRFWNAKEAEGLA